MCFSGGEYVLRKFFIYSLLLLLAGCQSENLITPQSNGKSVQVSATASELVQDEIQPQNKEPQSNPYSVWDEVAAKKRNENLNILLGVDGPEDIDLFNLYLEGLSHPSPYVEWYASNKIIEYDYRPDKQKAIDALQLLLKSPEDNVKSSAQFPLNVLERNFDDPAIVRSPDGKRVAFHQFLEARYNDGRVWIYDTEMDAIYPLNGNWLNVARLIWSPDSKKLAIESMGRIWFSVDLINVDDSKLVDSKSLLSKSVTEVIIDKKYYPPIVTQQRPDYYTKLVEWSPDSTKAMMSYSFTDDEFKTQQGIVIYDIKKAAYTTVKKYPSDYEGSHDEIVKPDGFIW
jgi:hypothetical protein